MLTEYIRAAMHLATYKILSDDGSFYGEIPDLQGVYANEITLEACRDELQSTLEDWILFGVCQHALIPVINGLDINIYPIRDIIDKDRSS